MTSPAEPKESLRQLRERVAGEPAPVWELSDETREAIRLIEEHLKLSAIQSQFIICGDALIAQEES